MTTRLNVFNDHVYNMTSNSVFCVVLLFIYLEIKRQATNRS